MVSLRRNKETFGRRFDAQPTLDLCKKRDRPGCGGGLRSRHHVPGAAGGAVSGVYRPEGAVSAAVSYGCRGGLSGLRRLPLADLADAAQEQQRQSPGYFAGSAPLFQLHAGDQ